VSLAIIAAVFPVIFIGELPDKTMFASLVLATRGRPFSVWLGAAGAFLIHVVIAVSIGVALFKIVPEQAIHFVVAGLFALSAVAAFIAARDAQPHQEEIIQEHKAGRVAGTAFVVVFLAEWGDLTQVLTANLAARYHSPLNVGLGALLALWSVSAIATVSGRQLVRILPGVLLRRITGVACSVLAVVALVATIRG
jgi:putative Ca2+/H+ antiporter (TMEM165/GDT1 family)